MIVMERLRPGCTNISMRLVAPDVSVNAIRRAAEAVVAKHDALRMMLIRKTSEVIVSDESHPEVIVSEEPIEVLNHIRRPISPEADEPNVRVVVDSSARPQRVVRLIVPHAFVDARSFELLYEDLSRLLHDPSRSNGSDAGVGFGDHAVQVCQALESPAESVLGFWEDQLSEVQPIPKDLFLDQADPGYVDVPLGTPEMLYRIQLRFKVTEFVILCSLFAHGLRYIFDGSPVLCRTPFVGRRSKRHMKTVGPFFELTLLKLGGTPDLVDRTVQASVLQLLKAPQPRAPLHRRLSARARAAVHQPVCIFEDHRRFLAGARRKSFAADNQHLFIRELQPASGGHRSARQLEGALGGGHLSFAPVDNVALHGAELPIRGEVIHKTGERVIYLRILTSTVDRERVLDAASAIRQRCIEMTS